jgi:hypothetical protein
VYYQKKLQPMYEQSPEYETLRNEFAVFMTLGKEKETQQLRSLLHYTFLGGKNVWNKYSFEEIAELMTASYVDGRYYSRYRVKHLYDVLLPEFERDPVYESVRNELIKRMGGTMSASEIKEDADKKVNAFQRITEKASKIELKAKIAEEAAEKLSMRVAHEEAKSSFRS